MCCRNSGCLGLYFIMFAFLLSTSDLISFMSCLIALLSSFICFRMCVTFYFEMSPSSEQLENTSRQARVIVVRWSLFLYRLFNCFE